MKVFVLEKATTIPGIRFTRNFRIIDLYGNHHVTMYFIKNETKILNNFGLCSTMCSCLTKGGFFFK